MSPTLSRRTLLLAGAATASGGVGTAGYGWLVEPHAARIVSHRLPVAGLPASWVGRTVVQLTDVHVGPHVDDAYVLSVFERVAAMQPDLVVLTGDLTSDEPGIAAHAADVYARLPPGRLGTLAVLGNHDFGQDWLDGVHADTIVDAVGAAGRVRFLRNESVQIDGLTFFGTDDLWSGRLDLRAATAGLASDTPAIGLVHNPDALDLPGWGRFGGWVLSGHTHGGQVRLPLAGPLLLPVENRRYVAGEYATPGGRRVYISRGVGHASVPIRINCPPEVTVHRLERA